MSKPKLYTASKLSKALLWRQLRKEWPEIEFTSRWIDAHYDFQGGRIPEVCKQFWIEDHEDVVRSNFLMLFAVVGEHLRGGLVEAGIALAHKIPVLVISNHEDFGSWQYHPGVVRLPDLDAARKFINDTAR